MGINEIILKYLKDQNRPYNANDIHQNLHKQFGKPAVQKALDYLVAKHMILEKKYGKQKVYAIMRSGKFNKQEYQARQDALQMKHDAQELKINTDEARLKAMEIELKELKNSMTTSCAKQLRDELQHEHAELTARYEKLLNKSQLITEDQKKKLCEEQVQMEKEWKKRRRMALDMLDAILEHYPHDKKTLYEEIGIETDEDAAQGYK